MATESISPLKKTCTKCGVELPATSEYFSRQKRGKYGLKSICHECQRAYKSAWDVEHHAALQAYYIEHREKIIAYNATHAEHRRALAAIRYNENREEIIAKRKDYYTNHREEVCLYKKKYLATPEGNAKIKAGNHRRRVRLANAKGDFTPEELRAVIAAHTDKQGVLHCAFCGKPITGAFHVDHWIPLHLGGTNDAGNLRIMHGKRTDNDKCNLIKGARHPHKLGKLI